MDDARIPAISLAYIKEGKLRNKSALALKLLNQSPVK